MTKSNYEEKIGFLSRPELKKALEEYSLKEGVKTAVICRKALYEYLLKRGVISKSKRYY